MNIERWNTNVSTNEQSFKLQKTTLFGHQLNIVLLCSKFFLRQRPNKTGNIVDVVVLQSYDDTNCY